MTSRKFQSALRPLIRSVGNKRLYLQNSALFLTERIVGIALSFLVYVALARVYGPELLGIYSYVQTVMLFAVPFLASGSEGIIVRELVRRTRPQNDIMGSSFVVLTATGFTTTVLPLAALIILQGQEQLLIMMASFTAIGFIPSGFLIIEHWFRSEQSAVPIIAARTTSAALATIAKLWLIFTHQPIAYVVLVTAIEAFVLTAILIIIYQRQAAIRNWRFDPGYAGYIFRQTFPGMIASIAVMVYFRTNHILLVYLSGYDAVGQYAVAFQTAQLFLVLPTVFFSAIYPRLVHLHTHDPARYRVVMNIVYWSFSAAGYAIFIFCLLFVQPVFRFVFGERYDLAGQIIVILALANIPNFSGAVRGRAIDIARSPHYHIWSALAGLAIVVPASWLAIPTYGAIGAAWCIAIATLASAVLTTFFLPNVREDGLVQLKALALIPSFRISDI